MLRLDGLATRFGGGTLAAGRGRDGGAGAVWSGCASNGAGKSPLPRVILGLVAPARGRIERAGGDVTREPVLRRARAIGRIAQDPGESTCAAMTIEENLAM